jgi:putative ABC transport system permease protein
MLFLKLLSESIKMAINALIVNRLRTVLSLLGITIGILAIIAVFTLVDSMEHNIRTNVESLGSNTVYVQKWPWAMGGEYEWWKFWQRPHPQLHETKTIQERCGAAEAVCFMVSKGQTVEGNGNLVNGAAMVAVTHDWNQIKTFDLAAGRYFTEQESANGKNVCLVGMAISQGLYGPVNPVGRTLKLKGQNFTVIGVFGTEGESMFGASLDSYLLIPVEKVKRFFRLDGNGMNPLIMVKGKDGVSVDELKSELAGVMRSVRRLKPTADDNFALNEISLLANGLDQFFGIMTISGWFIGGFSLLVGGFGIANIMFVSVKERTNLIGIQKSLGAKNWFILIAFLSEAVVLCLIGGGAGVAIVYLGALAVSVFMDIELYLTMSNVVMGMGISALIGLLAGVVPAYIASRMDPVEAIRSA